MATLIPASMRLGRNTLVPLCVSAGAILTIAVISRRISLTRSADVVLSPKDTVLPSLSADEIAALPYPPDAIPGGRDVDTPYGSIRVYEWGPEDGKRVVLLHGISTPSIALAGLANRLVKKGCRVMLFDLFGRGYSSSPPPTMSHDYRLYTTQLLLALASSRTPWPTFALLGYSFGGALAANFTAHFPHLVTGLILIAPGGLLRESHISWKSRFLYASPPLLPKVMVEKFVRERLWSGERSIEPEHASTGKEKDGDSKGKGKAVRFTNPPPSVASSVSSKGSKKKDKENTSSHKKNSTKKDSSETKAKKSDKKSDKKDKSKKGKEKAERKEHESESNDKESAEAIEGPSESSAHAEEREKGDGEGEKGEEKTRGFSSPNLYESGARPLLKKHPVSTISNVVHWQIRHYPAFIPAFISTIQNAPVHGQHHIWARIGARLKHQRSHPEDKEARTLGLDSGKVLLILGEHDKIVVVEEVKEDTEEVLGKENVKTWMMDAGHEVPIEKAEEVSKVVGWYLGARGH